MKLPLLAHRKDIVWKIRRFEIAKENGHPSIRGKTPKWDDIIDPHGMLP